MNTKKFIGLVVLSVFIVAGGIYYFSTSKEIIYIAGYQKKSTAPPVLFEIDYEESTVDEHHPFKFVTRPKSMDVAIDKEKLYVGGIGEGIDVIDLKTLGRDKSLPLKGPIRGIVVTSKGDKLFIPNPKKFGSNERSDINPERETVIFSSPEMDVEGYVSRFLNPHYFYSRDYHFCSYAWPFTKYKFSLKEDSYVYSYTKRETVLSNDGIQPHNKKISTPFPKIGDKKLTFYDRDSGKIVKKINLSKKFNFEFYAAKPQYPILSNNFQKCFFIIHAKNSKKLAVVDLTDKQVSKVLTLTSKKLSEITNIIPYKKK